MDTLPKKPLSSRLERGNRDRDRNHRPRNREKDRDRDRSHNHRAHPRRRSPSPPYHHHSKRHRPSSKPHNKNKGKEKEKEPEPADPEPGEIRYQSPQIGDDFVPLFGNDVDASPTHGPRSEWARQKDRASVREWDVGKRSGSDFEGRGTKRKYGAALDDEDDRAQRRRQRFEPYDTRKTPWVSQVDWDSCRNVAELLHREVEAFVKYMSPTPVEDEIRGLVIQLVSKAITAAFPDARILPFGSYETKLYLPSGDIDLVIDSPAMARSNKVHVLHALANTIKRAGITSKVTVISRAKVPIIKFVAHYGRLNVDISVNQSNGVTVGKIVNGFLQDMRGCGFALRCLIVIAKAFLNQRDMNEVYTGGLGSYSIVCMAISFLQMHPKIRRAEIEPGSNLGVLVMEFFELYGSYFNYEEVGISIRNGGSYFCKRERGWYDSSQALLLSIEDPMDMANDISKGSYGIRKVRQTLAGAYGIMQATAYMRAGILSSRREGRSYSLRGEANAADMSILSSILGVTQETIDNRRLLEEVYETRLLHKLLQVSPQASVVAGDALTDADGKGKAGTENGREEWELEDEAGHEAAEAGNDSDESGRYDIQERGTRSDARGMGRYDAPTTYTTDEEDEAYESAGTDEDMRKRRRSYWLSKGVGAGESDEEDGVA